MNTAVKDNIIISSDKSKLDINIIHNFLSTSYWAKGISLSTLKKAIENSICFGIYDSDKQFGFARVVTDCITFAYLFDVFIIESYRKKGYSIRLLKEVFSHPIFQDVKRWMLATSDAQDLYRKFGFEQIDHPEKLMVLKKK